MHIFKNKGLVNILLHNNISTLSENKKLSKNMLIHSRYQVLEEKMNEQKYTLYKKVLANSLGSCQIIQRFFSIESIAWFNPLSSDKLAIKISSTLIALDLENKISWFEHISVFPHKCFLKY